MNKQAVETTKKRYGENYFKILGKKGAQKFWQKYFLLPIGTSRFGIYQKSDFKFINFFGGGYSIAERLSEKEY
jgi:hypothetical protein